MNCYIIHEVLYGTISVVWYINCSMIHKLLYDTIIVIWYMVFCDTDL